MDKIFTFFIFWAQNTSLVVKIPIFTNFTTSDVFSTQKIKKVKILLVQFFLIGCFYNLAKFQLYSPSRAKALGKNIKLQFSPFEVRRPILDKNLPVFAQKFSKTLKICQVWRFYMIQYIQFHEITPKNMFKSHFGGKYWRFQPFLTPFFIKRRYW